MVAVHARARERMSMARLRVWWVRTSDGAREAEWDEAEKVTQTRQGRSSSSVWELA